MDLFDLLEQNDFQTLHQYLSSLKESDNFEQLEYIINKKDGFKYSPLHKTLFERKFEVFNTLLEFGADINNKCFGTPPLIICVCIASLPDGLPFAFECFKKMLSISALNPFAKDDSGFTVLHYVAKYDLFEWAIELSKVVEFQDLVNTSSKSGASPLHVAASFNSRNCLDFFLNNGGNPAKKLSMTGETVAHVAARFFSMDALKILQDQNVDLNEIDFIGLKPKDYLSFASFSQNKERHLTTGIYSSEACFSHHTCSDSAFDDADIPPENVNRLKVLLEEKNGILRGTDLSPRLTYKLDCTEGMISDVLRVHEWSYAKRVKEICNELNEDINEEDGIGKLDGDTTISRGTYSAALSAVGAVCCAIDAVISNNIRNAFCPVRPPGHHAGPRGACGEGSSLSHGFCIFNNVAVGAAYAMNRYRDQIRKVAIVDFDVHHGNGTEEIVRLLAPRVEKCAIQCDIAFGSLMTHTYKPWFSENDPENVLFVSVHGYGPRSRGLEALFPMASFYPGTGATTVPRDEGPLILDIGVPLPSLNFQDSKNLDELDNRLKWRNFYRDEIFPRIVEFSPDLILISAGFDAHKKDTINAGYISIIEDDYSWVTDQLVCIANQCCSGRVVSVLEGGYQIGGEFTSAFAKSVAAHVNSLAHGAASVRGYDLNLNEKEKDVEQKYLEKLKAAYLREQEAILKQQQEAVSETQEKGESREEHTGRKRKRNQVDYVALDKELAKQSDKN